MTPPVFRALTNKTNLTDLATMMISARLQDDINDNGLASFMVSGGSTPGPIYEKLSQTALPWNKVKIGLVDERWVEETDKGSNAALIRNTLLQNRASTAHFIPMKSNHASPLKGQATVNTLYQNIPKPYSVTVLGMGNDGHTASWFPDANGLESALNPINKQTVQAITAVQSTVTGAYLERMTLTRSAVRTSMQAILLLVGQEKRKVYEQALQNTHSQLPVRTLIDDLGNKLTVLWTA